MGRPGISPGGRLATRAGVIAVLALAGASLASACGLEVMGTATVDGGVTPTSDSGASLPPTILDGGEEASTQDDCPAPRVLCNGVCTDTTADPANCKGCGMACKAGETCNDGACDVLCLGGTTACRGQCVDTKSDPANCGGCGGKPACGGSTPYCVAGKCVPDCTAPSELCTPDAGAAYCADTKTDRKNCGSCGHDCGGESFACVNGTCQQLCAPTATGSELFGTTMVGCIGKVGWPARASLCPNGTHACSVAEWIARRGTVTPTYNYWVNDQMGWSGDGTNDCRADTTQVFACGGGGGGVGNNPMRVCGAKTDKVGNNCNWTGCGYRTRTPSQFLGGCQNNPTAGTLCCR